MEPVSSGRPCNCPQSQMQKDSKENGVVLHSSMEPPEDYFKSYEDLAVHRLMLDDSARIDAYKHAIDAIKDFLVGRVVMDVGAGTGILSMLCARAGARKVYAVEASGIASVASRLVEANNLSHVVQVLQNKVEELELPEGEKVDAIVSEWMGFYLLHESMLDSVLVARDRFLAPGGKILPEMATLVACPCSLPRYHSHWREDFYGLDLSLFGELERSSRGTQPLITDVHPEDLLAEPVTIWQLDLQQAKCADLDCLRDQRVVLLNREGSFEGLCLWFECRFPGQGGVLSTGPAAPRTHWQQTALVLPSIHPVEAFECVAWELVLARSSDDTRHYNIQLSLLDPDTEPHPIPCDCIAPRCALIGCVVEQYQKTHHN